MKTKIVFLLISLFFLSTNYAYSQNVNELLNRAKKKAIKSVERKVESETKAIVDKAVDKAVDKTVEKTKEKINENKKQKNTTKNKEEAIEVEEATEIETNSQPTNQSSKKDENTEENLTDLINKYSGGENLVYENSYKFNAEAKYLMESFDEKEESSGKAYYRILLNEPSNNSAMILESVENSSEKEASIFLFDEKNQVSILLNQADKSGILMSIASSNKETEVNNEEVKEHSKVVDENTNYKKTGNSKKILGYKCQEYISATETTETRIWTTNELSYKNNSSLNKLSKINNSYTTGVYPSGYIMEMESINLENNSRFTYIIKEFSSSKSNTIDISDYKLVKVGSNFSNKK